MKTILTGRDHEILVELFRKMKGEAWEPRDVRLPFFERAIEAGYLRRADGYCGVERFKDSMIAWTEAGHNALTMADTIMAPVREREFRTHRMLDRAASN